MYDRIVYPIRPAQLVVVQVAYSVPEIAHIVHSLGILVMQP